MRNPPTDDGQDEPRSSRTGEHAVEVYDPGQGTRTASIPAQPDTPDAPVPPEREPSRLARLARRASWNITDQVITAVTNTALFVVLAHSVSVDRLDAFTNAFYVFTLTIGVGRALVGQVLSVRFSDTTGQPWRTALGQAFGFTLVLTVSVSVVVAAVGGVLITAGSTRSATSGSALLALALVLPALIGQDACRMAFFAQSNARQAALNDGLWALLQFGGIAVLIVLGHAQVAYLVLVWGAGAAVCVALALTQLRVVPEVRGTRVWTRRTWDLSRFFLAENLLTQGAFNGGFLLVGAMVGEGAVSAIRGAQVLLGPLESLNSAMFTFALPELARRAHLAARTRWKIALTASGGMLLIALLYTTALWVLPEGIGHLIFRDKWDSSRDILLPVALGSAAARACLGPAVTIYAMGLARRTFRLMLVEAPLVLTLMITGALTHGVDGAAWGLATNQIALVPLWFLTLRGVLRMTPAERETEALGGSFDHQRPPDAAPGPP